MRRAGRPQGRLKGATAEANALAQFVRDITAGRSVRSLAQSYRLGKTTWSEYRSAEKVIPWHWLEQLIQDLPAQAPVRSRLLTQATQLHRAATRAAEGHPWPSSPKDAIPQNRAGVALPAHESTARLPVLRRRASTALAIPAKESGGHALPIQGEVLGAADLPHSTAVVRREQPPGPVRHTLGRMRLLALAPGTPGRPPTRRRRLTAGSALAIALLLVAVGVLLGGHTAAPPATGVWSAEPATTDSAPQQHPKEPLPRAETPPPLPPPTSGNTTPPAPPPVAPPVTGPSVRDADRHGPGDASTRPRTFLPSAGDQTVPPAPSGTLYAIAPDHRSIRQWQGHGDVWSRIGGPADHILAGRAGLFAVDADSKQLLGYLGTPGSWAPVSEPAAEFAISGDQLYRIAADHSAVHRWNGTGTAWTVVGGPADHLYGGGAGLFATHPGDGRIYRFDSATNFWPYVGNAGADFAVTDRHLYGLTPDRGEVFQWSGGASSSWFRVGGPAASLHAGPDHVFATSTDHGTLLRYTGSAESWVPASEAGAEFTFTAGHLFRLSPDRGTVFHGTPSAPGVWTRIGGPAAALAASG